MLVCRGKGRNLDFCFMFKVLLYKNGRIQVMHMVTVAKSCDVIFLYCRLLY